MCGTSASLAHLGCGGDATGNHATAAGSSSVPFSVWTVTRSCAQSITRLWRVFTPREGRNGWPIALHVSRSYRYPLLSLSAAANCYNIGSKVDACVASQFGVHSTRRPPETEIQSSRHDGEMHDVAASTERPEARLCELDQQISVAREQIASLERALASSRRIGMAIGILMARRRVTDAVAFQLLSQASQQRNRKLRNLAEEVIETGDIPSR